MTNYLTKNESFHIFSKSPVLSDMAVSQAVNKSGHTVSVSDLWSDDIPWFTEVAEEEEAIKRAGDAKYNDLILWGSNIYKRKGDKTNGASSGTTFENLWEEFTELKDARNFALSSVTNATPSNIVPKTIEIRNSSDRVVIKYHVGKPIDLLTVKNNAKVPSTWAARMFINDKVVDQFVSPTDKVFAGNPSTGYTTLVYTATTEDNKYTFVSEGEEDDDFVNNAYAGIIQFNDSRESTHKFAASIFEYVGRKLDITDTIDDDTIDDDSKAVVPTSKAVYDHVKSHEDKNIHITSSERTSWNNKISGIIEGDTIINCELNETSKSVTLSLKQDEVFKNSVCVCDIQSLEEDGKEYIIYDDSCSPKYISFAEKIINGENMFMNQLLKHFRINLHNMTNGKNMFINCTLLQHFDSDLSSLTEAKDMFGYCCLSLKSVKNIADKINTVTSGDLGNLGINSKYQNNEELNEALAILTSKGWSYNAQYRNL